MKAYFCGYPRGFTPGNVLEELQRFSSRIVQSAPLEADFLFASHRPRSMREMLSIPDRGQIRIFIGGEALAADFNLFDYALSYDSTIKSFRHFRPHTLISFSRDLRFGGINRGSEDDSPGFADRTRFCDFIYANRNGHAMRAKIFSELSLRFGGVESLGKFMNNNKTFLTQSRETEKHRNWRAEKIKLQEGSLFSIAAENARFPGYTSEKLLTSLAAGSVPI